MTRLIIVISVLLNAFGCAANQKEGTPVQPSDAPHGAQQPPRIEQQPVLSGASGFRYTVGDDAGQAQAHGTLIIPWPAADGQDFRGTWQARPAMGAISTTKPTNETPKIGPQLGGGQLVGHREGDTIRLQLNPNMNDNNVTLVGQIDATGDTIRGAWEWSTFTGVTARGQFAATRSE